MTSNFDPTGLEKLFRLLEPEALFVEDGFQTCRLKLLKFFAWRYCEDPDNLADETISRLLKNIGAGQEISAEHAYSYVYAIAKNVFYEYLRAKKKSGILTDLEDFQETAPPARAADCRKICLEQLSAAKLELLEHYYLDDVDSDDIARELGLTLNALRLQIHHCKVGLKRCLKDCIKRGDSIRN